MVIAVCVLIVLSSATQSATTKLFNQLGIVKNEYIQRADFGLLSFHFLAHFGREGALFFAMRITAIYLFVNKCKFNLCFVKNGGKIEFVKEFLKKMR